MVFVGKEALKRIGWLFVRINSHEFAHLTFVNQKTTPAEFPLYFQA